MKKEQSNESFFRRITRHQLFIPVAALLALVVFNLIADPSFFSVSLKENSLGNPVLSGNIISVLDNASELVLLAIGMTLVTASSGGQDISVGATMAIAGSVILRLVCGGQVSADTMQTPLILAVLAGIVVTMAFGAFNGTLVAYFKIQPMVATLIMFTAGRSIAAWINNNQLPFINDVAFKYAGTFLPGIPVPTPVFITLFMILAFWLVLKFTNLGLYTQAVGINANSSRLNGLDPKKIKLLTYVILGACVAIAGFIRVSRSGSITIPASRRTSRWTPSWRWPWAATVWAAASSTSTAPSWGPMSSSSSPRRCISTTCPPRPCRPTRQWWSSCWWCSAPPWSGKSCPT